MEGFDYRSQTPQLPVSEWRKVLAEVIVAGGRRRVEHGETFAHDANGEILFEIYGNVSVK